MKRILKNILIGFLLFVGAIFFIIENQIGGFRAFIVTSASMEPTIQTGSLVITQYTHPHLLQSQDIITFLPPTKEREFVTHRVIKAIPQETLTTFTTKGDNNTNHDPWIVTGGAVIGRVVATIPFLGFFVAFLQSKLGILFFIIFPCIYIVIDEIYAIFHTIKNHKKNTNLFL